MTLTTEQLKAFLVDRHRIEREAPRGGLATVYLAYTLKHDCDVALKVLHPDLAASVGGDHFGREIRLAARLQHAHLLTVFGYAHRPLRGNPRFEKLMAAR